MSASVYTTRRRDLASRVVDSALTRRPSADTGALAIVETQLAELIEEARAGRGAAWVADMERRFPAEPIPVLDSHGQVAAHAHITPMPAVKHAGELGAEAFREGLPSSANPFNSRTEPAGFTAWIDGWRAAEAEAKKGVAQ